MSLSLTQIEAILSAEKTRLSAELREIGTLLEIVEECEAPLDDIDARIEAELISDLVASNIAAQDKLGSLAAVLEDVRYAIRQDVELAGVNAFPVRPTSRDLLVLANVISKSVLELMEGPVPGVRAA